MQHQFDLAKAKVVFTIGALAANAREAAGARPVVVMDDSDETWKKLLSGIWILCDFLFLKNGKKFEFLNGVCVKTTTAEPLKEQVPVNADDVVALPFSSGTTGLSKGVMLTHRNLISNIAQQA